METTIEALQNLYVSKGGNFSDVENINTIPDMLNAFADFQEEQETAVSSDEINEIINSIE